MSATPIVLVHPMWNSGSFWSESAELLAEDAVVDTPDMPGHASAPGPFTADSAVATIIEAAKKHGEPVDLVGLSLGARVALAAAAQAPDAVRSLTLMGIGSDVSGFAAAIQSTMLRLLGGNLAKRLGSSESPATAAESVKAQPRLPIAANAAKITSPTLVVAGGDDSDFAESCKNAATAISGARLTIVPGAEHLWPKDRPREFVALLRDWRQEQS